MAQGLKKGSTLQGGTYRIEEILGQGTFGITYLATMKEKVSGRLGMMEVDLKVAIKEFFMSDENGRKAITAVGLSWCNYRHGNTQAAAEDTVDWAEVEVAADSAYYDSAYYYDYDTIAAEEVEVIDSVAR
ncbi:MAG: hypothetical protein K2K98_08695 [Muribaculaceae bacterium]|nr:hypothetical protein [Muribaculaceae bacterium]